MEEPDKDDGSVLQEGESIVEHVFVPGAFLLGVEEHEDIDDTCKVGVLQSLQKPSCMILLYYQGQGQRETLHTECCRQWCAGRSPRRPSPKKARA